MFCFHIIFIVFFIGFSYCSQGDQTFNFHRCVGYCRMKFCRGDKFIYKKKFPHILLNVDKYSLSHKIQFAILWKCPNECKYICMWETVEVFKNDGLNVPQFFGKWPLLRVIGIEEIASAVASVLNLIVTTFMFNKFLNCVPKSSQCYNLWWLHYITACIAWISATIFHISDTWLTEKCDYFSALLFAVSASYLTVIRVYELSRRFIKVLIAALFSVFFMFHVSYLLLVKFDYTYNMTVFVVIGSFNVISWIFWGLRNRNLHQSRFIMIWAISLALLSILEFKEFTPIFWLFDSHSMWHFGTIFITIPLYKFAIMDCLYLQKLKGKIE